jgi:hypothetical protein
MERSGENYVENIADPIYRNKGGEVQITCIKFGHNTFNSTYRAVIKYIFAKEYKVFYKNLLNLHY